MATSAFGHIPHVMNHVYLSNPKSVLDVGIGFGRWGSLVREILDVLNERVSKDTWKIRIDGIEIYAPYILDHQRYIYDTIHIGDAVDVIKTLGEYDMIIIGDMLEHLEKDRGWELFHLAMEKSAMGLILNLPIGEEWLRETGHDNKYEDHLAWWTMDEFDNYLPDTFIRKLGNGSLHASMFISSVNYRYAQALDEGENERDKGNNASSITLFQSAVKIDPKRPDAYSLLAETLIIGAQAEKAVSVLETMAVECPEYVHGLISLATLQNMVGKKEDAVKNARLALEKCGADDQLKTEAEQLLKSIQE